MSKLSVRRHLRWYDKVSEMAVGDEDLKGIDFQTLQQLFGTPARDLMYDCWEVKQEHLARIQKCVSHRLNPEKYDYFVEACASGECGS